MKIELIKMSNGTYRLISCSNHKNTALREIASLLDGNNKFSSTKIGVFNVVSNIGQPFVSVYSYISHKHERMTRKQYLKWIKGSKPVIRKEIPKEESIV